VTIESRSDLEGLQAVGRLVAQTLAAMREAVAVGTTTGALDEIGERVARRAGARSAPQQTYEFPGFNCISVNDEIVHGVPGARVLRAGDVVKLDVTLEFDGFVADSAVTVLVPPVLDDVRRLQRCARSAFNQALQEARAGAPISAIGRAVERVARRDGFSVLRELTGHGVGRRIHEPPAVLNVFEAASSEPLVEGLVLAVEPLLSLQPARVEEAPDGWTLRTHNRAVAVHHEHTIVVRRGEPLVVTRAA